MKTLKITIDTVQDGSYFSNNTMHICQRKLNIFTDFKL